MQPHAWQLPKGWAWFIVPPILVFVATNLLLAAWGGASLPAATLPDQGGHAEAAGRFRTFATFVLFAAMAVAGLVLAAGAARDLDRRSRIGLGRAYVASVALGATLTLAMGLLSANTPMERDIPCASLADRPIVASQSEQTPARKLVEAPAPSRAGETVAQRNTKTSCPSANNGLAWDLFGLPKGGVSDRFVQLRILFLASAILLIIAMPAVILGAIACLALPVKESEAECVAEWRLQTQRLNQVLYITAGFMVAGLLFMSARLSWPGYSLAAADVGRFGEHVSSLVLYAGVSYSVLIASYYLPVAAALAARRAAIMATPAAAAAETPAGSPKDPDPFGAFRTAVTILSPALVGLIGEVMKFGG